MSLVSVDEQSFSASSGVKISVALGSTCVQLSVADNNYNDIPFLPQIWFRAFHLRWRLQFGMKQRLRTAWSEEVTHIPPISWNWEKLFALSNLRCKLRSLPLMKFVSNRSLFYGGSKKISEVNRNSQSLWLLGYTSLLTNQNKKYFNHQ